MIELFFLVLTAIVACLLLGFYAWWPTLTNPRRRPRPSSSADAVEKSEFAAREAHAENAGELSAKEH